MEVSNQYYFFECQDAQGNEYIIKNWGGATYELYAKSDNNEILLEAFSNFNDLDKESMKEYVRELLSEYLESVASLHGAF